MNAFQISTMPESQSLVGRCSHALPEASGQVLSIIFVQAEFVGRLAVD